MSDLPEPLKTRVKTAGWVPIEFIGKGGGAKVYLCVNADQMSAIETLMRGWGGHILKCLSTGLVRKKNALAALKVPLDTENSTAFMRLKREIEAMRAIQHPSLIRLFGADDKDPPEWFAMEWHPNGDLSKYVDTYKGNIVRTLQGYCAYCRCSGFNSSKGVGPSRCKTWQYFCFGPRPAGTRRFWHSFSH